MEKSYAPASSILKKATALLLCGVLFCGSIVWQNKKAPAILTIFTDDHAYRFRCAYRSFLMQMPNINRIAKGVARFSNVFVISILCVPSRATPLTGKGCHIHGLNLNKVCISFSIQQPSFLRILQQHNYQHAWQGKWHLRILLGGFNCWKVLPLHTECSMQPTQMSCIVRSPTALPRFGANNSGIFRRYGSKEQGNAQIIKYV